MKKKDIKLQVWLEWLCEECGYRQEKVKDEEWQKHCDQMMRMQPYRKFVFN